MKGRLKLLLPLLLLIVALTFMVKDLFINKSLHQNNPYEYNLDKLKNVEENLISHKEIKVFFRMSEDYLQSLLTKKIIFMLLL